MSGFKPSAVGIAGSALRAASNIFGGILGNVGNPAYEIERAVQGSGHDKAFPKPTCGTRARELSSRAGLPFRQFAGTDL